MDITADRGDLQYWSRHFGMGIAMSVLAASVVLTRTYARTDVPVQGISVALAVLVLVSVPVLLILARRILAMQRLRVFLYAWDFFGVAAVTTWAALDGGGSSPYSSFFYVLVGHAALAFRPCATVISGVLVALARLVLGLFDARESVIDTLIYVLAVGLLATVATLMARGQRVLVGRAKTLAEQAVRLADIDGLTGCLNHRAFHARLVEEAARAASGHPLSVLVLDVDFFKAINDAYGHLAGDEVLARLGSVLRENFRAQDVVGRIGGDEFAVLLPDADNGTAEALERRLLKEFADGALPHGGRVTIGSASTAVATDARRLLGSADAQLYSKRRRGRGPLSSTATTDVGSQARSGSA